MAVLAGHKKAGAKRRYFGGFGGSIKKHLFGFFGAIKNRLALFLLAD